MFCCIRYVVLQIASRYQRTTQRHQQPRSNIAAAAQPCVVFISDLLIRTMYSQQVFLRRSAKIMAPAKD